MGRGVSCSVETGGPPPLQPSRVWVAIPHPEKGKYIQDLDGPVVPGLQQVVDTVMNGMYRSAVLKEQEEDALSSRPAEGQEGLGNGSKGQEGSMNLVSKSKAADDTASE